MGFIRMSPEFITGCTTKFMMLNEVTTATAAVSTGQNIAGRGLLVSHNGGNTNNTQVGARLAILKGTVPTDFSTLTSYSARSSDTLVLFDSTGLTSSTGINQFSGSQVNMNPMIINTSYVNAIASGTATWFWWFTTPMLVTPANTFNNAIVPYNQIVGTIGITGSGADLTLPSVSLTAGSPYRIYTYRLQIPTSWDF